MKKKELYVNRYDTMQALSDRARDYLAQCDQGALKDLFGDCTNIQEIEDRVSEYIEIDMILEELERGEKK